MAERRHRVVLLCDRVGGGGIAQVVINTAINLDRDRFDPVVCLSRDAEQMDHGRRLADAGVEVIELGRTSATQIRPWLRLLPHLRRATVLHSHGEMTNHWARLWATVARTPILITQYHSAVEEKSPLSKHLDRRTAFLADAVVTVSAHDRERTLAVEGHRPDKVHVVPNGIDVDRFRSSGATATTSAGVTAAITAPDLREAAGIAPGATVVAMIARLVPLKNHVLALEAFRRLIDQSDRPAHLLLVGEGPLEAELRSTVDRLDLADRVTFLGQRPDVPDILATTDVLLLPSRSECLPMTVLEAMAAGCAIVASPVGGIPEALDGVGWPEASADDPDATAAALTEVLAMDHAARAERVERGRARVREVFSAEAAARTTEALYDDLIGRRAGIRSDPDSPAVLHVGGWPMPFGGVNIHVRRLANHCHDAGLPTAVFDPYNTGRRPEPAPFPVEQPTGSTPARAARLIGAIRSRHDGWVHFHASRLAALSKLAPLLLAARRPGCAYAVTVHGSLGDSWDRYGPTTRALSRLFLRRVSLVIAVSDAVRRVLVEDVGVPDHRIAVVPGHLPPLDAERVGGLDDLGHRADAYRRWRAGFRHQALTTGALRPLYGLDLVARAAADERLADVGFVVSHYRPDGVDDGDRAVLDRLGARPNVFLVEDAPVPAYLELLASSDVFLRPTFEDGDSIALREAVADGVAVVASDCVARPDGSALFPTGDADALADTVAAVLAGVATTDRPGPERSEAGAFATGHGREPSGGERVIALYRARHPRSYTGLEGHRA